MNTSVAFLLGLAWVSGCGPGEAPIARTDSVSGAAASSPSAATPAASSSAPAKPRQLCSRAPKAAGKKPSDVKLGHIEADGESALGTSLVTAGGKWTWINLWAGWCGPCKEEMPLLKGWENKLASRLRVAYVSIDDDERLSKRFLNEQPKGGVRQSYALADLESRKEWLAALGVGDVPKLPLHVLLNPAGTVSCVIEGAIEASDLPQVEALVASGG